MLSQTFTGTGLPFLETLHLVVKMDDDTGSGCSVGQLTWAVAVNGTSIGSYGYLGGQSLGNVAIDESYGFASIAGTGATSDSYTITLTSTTTVCSGGGAWNWTSPGTTTLIE